MKQNYGTLSPRKERFKSRIYVISIFPSDIQKRYGGGHWKAIQAFHDLLEVERFKVIEFGLDEKRTSELISLCCSFEQVHLIFNYSFWPHLIKALKTNYPHFNICVHCHNAEAFQHWQRSQVRLSLGYHNIRNIYGSLRLLFQDQRCRQFADHLLGISDWDNRHYWKLLPGQATVEYLPYHSPWPKLRPHVQPMEWTARQNKVVCLPGGRDPIGLSQVKNFVQFANCVSSGHSYVDWSFDLSPGVYRSQESMDLGRVKLMPELNEPWDLLCTVRALAILTPLGFGTKTTIIDALTAGCHVLVDKTLAKRLPSNVRELCHEVDRSKPEQFRDIMKKIEHEPQPHHINDELIAQAKQTLEKVLTAL
jgi:hypothetical protein